MSSKEPISKKRSWNQRNSFTKTLFIQWKNWFVIFAYYDILSISYNFAAMKPRILNFITENYIARSPSDCSAILKEKEAAYRYMRSAQHSKESLIALSENMVPANDER